MANDNLTIGHLRFKCGNCGSFAFTIPDDPQPDDLITCKECGGQARYGDLRDDMTDLAAGHVREVLDNARGKGWRNRPR